MHSKRRGAGRSPSLTRSSIAAILGNATWALSQWALMVVLAQLGSPEIVGEYALALALCTPVFVLASLQLRNLYVADQSSAYSFREYWTVRLALMVVSALGVLGFAWIMGYSGGTLIVVGIIALSRALDGMADIYFAAWQRADRMDAVAGAMAVNGVVAVIALGGAMWLTRDLRYALCASAAGPALTLLVVVLGGRNLDERGSGSGVVEWRRLARLSASAVPLGAVMVLVALQANVPRYFIERALGPFQLGMFAAANQLTLAGANMIAALGAVSAAPLARAHACGDYAAFRRLTLRLAAGGCSAGVLGSVVSWGMGAWVLSVVYGEEYVSAYYVLIWLSVGAAFSYAGSFFGYAMTMARYRVPQIMLFVAVVGVTTVAAWLLVARFGTAGAGMAVAVAGIVQVAGSVIVLRREILAGQMPQRVVME
jgi:O-antigen/teichoic acid export membrane protein